MIASQFYSRLSSASKVFCGRSGISFYCKTHDVNTFRHIAFFSARVFEIQKFSLHLYAYRHMAGHAKWQNIKNVKAEKDREKNMLCSKYSRIVATLVREKGPDPKMNIKLAGVLEEARKNNVPSSTLERALKRASSKKIQIGTIEMLGPGGCIVIFEYESDDICEMRRMIKYICRKYSVGLFPSSSERWRAVYEQKGIIRVIKQLKGESIDSEKMLDAAIEAGAEDVQKSEDGDMYEFLCAPEDINLVKKELEQNFAIEEAFVGYLPSCTVSLSKEVKTLALSFLNELGELPDVSRIYENIE